MKSKYKRSALATSALPLEFLDDDVDELLGLEILNNSVGCGRVVAAFVYHSTTS
jgi:hypothetical protein